MNPKVERMLAAALHPLAPDGRPLPHRGWQRVLSKAVTHLLPPLHQSPWMEWLYGTWVGAFAGYDELGRQLGEANVLPAWRATPLPDKWLVFKGPGSRQGHPYNVDALHEMVRCWDDLLRDARTLREWYCRHFKRDERQRLAATDLYVMTSVAVSLSSFLMRRGDAPTPDGALPRQAAAAFKVMGGLYAATNRLVSQAHPMLGQTELNVEAFLQYLEDEGLLLSPEMRACAGPAKMIRQILETFIEPGSAAPTGTGLAYLGADVERAFAYGVLCVRIDLGVLLYWRGLKHYLKPFLQHPDTPSGIHALLVQETELSMDDETPLRAYVEMAGKMLSLFEEAAAEQAFISALPAQEQDEHDIGFETKACQCYRLEMAMRILFDQQLTHRDRILLRQSPQWPEKAWLPIPCSLFLEKCFKTMPG